MDSLFKAAYYAASSMSGLIIGGLFLANLLGSSSPSETWRHKAILTVAAACGFGLLYLGFRLGHQQSRWLAGLGMAVLALVVGGAVMFFYGFFGLLGAYFVLSSLFGRLRFGSANQLTAKAVLLAATAAGGGLLYWAYQLGEVQARWLPGIGVVVLAVAAFQIVMVIGRIVFG